MQSFATGLGRSRIRRQSGSVATLGALWLMVAVICLTTIDIGNVFWQKRELQKIADLAALAGATGDLDNGFCQSNSASNSKFNGYEKVPESYPGNWVPKGNDNKAFFQKNINPYNACYVKVTRNVPFFFIFGSGANAGREVVAEAVAKQTRARVAQVGVRSKALEIDTTKSPILDLVVGGLLGGKIKIDAVGWQGLAKANINLLSFLKALAVNVNLDAADYQKVLSTNIGVGVVLDAMASVLSRDSTLSVAADALKILSAQAKLSSLKLNLGNLLGVSSPAKDAALDTQLNVLDLVQASLQLANKDHAVQLGLPIDLLGVAGVNLSLTVIESPQYGIGDPEYQDIVAKTGQVKLSIGVGTLFGLNPVSLDVGINAVNGKAVAYRGKYSCDSGNKFLNIEGSSSLVEINKLKLVVLWIPVIDTGERPPSLANGAQAFKIQPVKNVQEKLEDSDWMKLNSNSNIMGSVVGSVVDLIYSLLPNILPLGAKALIENLIDFILYPITKPLDMLIGYLLNLLGIGISVSEASGRLTCGYSSELVY